MYEINMGVEPMDKFWFDSIFVQALSNDVADKGLSNARPTMETKC